MINIYAKSFIKDSNATKMRRPELPSTLSGKRSRWFRLRPTVTVDLEKL